MNEIEMVREFNAKYGLPLGNQEAILDSKEDYSFRLTLLNEEYIECQVATNNFYNAGVDYRKGIGASKEVDKRKAALLKEMIDVVYILKGTALWCGITPREWKDAFKAVHESNMTKADVSSDHDRTDKIQKGPNYKDPDLHKILL